MKKILLAMSLVVLFCFASCGKNGETPSIPTTDRPFSSTVQIKFKDLSYTADLTYRNSASATLEITKPENLSGLIFTLSEGSLSAKYEGLDFPLDSLDARAKTAAGMLFSAISSAGTSSDININQAKNEFSVSGQIYSHKYDMVFDKESGAIKSFSVPQEELLVTFGNFKFLG